MLSFDHIVHDYLDYYDLYSDGHLIHTYKPAEMPSELAKCESDLAELSTWPDSDPGKAPLTALLTDLADLLRQAIGQ